VHAGIKTTSSKTLAATARITLVLKESPNRLFYRFQLDILLSLGLYAPPSSNFSTE
jgi:hypothetical protein